MKRTLLSTAFALLFGVSFAQDMIVKKDGSIIQAKIIKVGTSEVEYRKWTNIDGPLYSISTSDILAINYPNGEKENFSQIAASISTTQTTGYVEKSPASNNIEILAKYNKLYQPTNELKKSDKPAKRYFLIYGLKPTSVMSNDELEITFVRHLISHPYGGEYSSYYIRLTNKTDRILYIDKGNCFRVENDGSAYCYFENSEINTINSGNGTGISIGLGSVAGALGIGGSVGQLANGVGIGGGASLSLSTTYQQQRVIAIPPKASKYLTEEKCVKTSKGNLFVKPDYKWVEEAESFNYGRSISSLLSKNLVNIGKTKVFTENDSPLTRSYYITYSKDDNFAQYSSLKVNIYLHEIIGTKDLFIDHKYQLYDKYIEGFNDEGTICGYVDFDFVYL